MSAPYCFHLLPNCDKTLISRAAQNSPSVKVCNPDYIAPAYASGAFHVYYRPYMTGDNGGCSDGGAWAAQVLSGLRGVNAPWPDAIGFRNEMPATADDAKQYAYYRIALRNAGFKGQVVLGSFSVGNPDLAQLGTSDQWSPMWDAIKQVDPQNPWPDAVELHEYFDLNVSGCTPDYTLRHVTAISVGSLPDHIPIYIGESGSDALTNSQHHPLQDPQGRSGWQDRGKLTASQMITQLQYYRSKVSSSVVAIYLFVDGNVGNTQWGTYYSFGTDVETYLRSTWYKETASMIDLGVPVYSQLPPGDTDDNAYDDCGPTCVQMVESWLGFPLESITQIKGEMTGYPNFTGYTDTGEIASWFNSRGVNAKNYQSAQPSVDIRNAIEAGDPVIYLRYWDLDAQSGGHFVVARSYDPNGGAYGLNNPWGGVVDTWAASDIDGASSGGWLVVVEVSKTDLTALFNKQWQSYKPGVAINPGAAIYKSWLSGRQKGDTSKGVPTTDEFPYNNGSAQLFTGGIAIWNPSTGVGWY